VVQVLEVVPAELVDEESKVQLVHEVDQARSDCQAA
jgi:hypothetical protein